MNDVLVEAVQIAADENGIVRSSKGWKKTFTRMKQKYITYVAKISSSGCDGDDEGIFNKAHFFVEMHELEKDKARHWHPSVLSTESGRTVSNAQLQTDEKEL